MASSSRTRPSRLRLPIDPRSRGNFEVAEQHGRAIGRGAFDALEHAPSIADARIAARRLVVRLHVQHVYGVFLDKPPGG